MNKETRTIDDAQVRSTAALLEMDLDAIRFYAGDLKVKLEVLHKELEYADPIKDRLFEKFIYKLQRFITSLETLGELKQLAKVMEEFGLPSAAEVAEIIRQQKSDSVIPATCPGVVSERSRKAGIQFPLISHVEKHLIEETVHA